MKRREFIALVGGAVAAWPMVARAQQPKLPRIGVLVLSDPEPFLSEFRAGLREQGYIEGQNIVSEFRNADGKADLLRGLADELIRLNVDLIVAHQTPAVTAARQATTMRSTLSRMNSSARPRRRSALPSALRNSNTMFCPSM